MSQSPTIAYPGGKGRLAPEIVSFLPKYGRTYVEPFVGRGNLFWSAVSAGLKYEGWWLNDIATIPFFRAINQIGHVVDVPEHSRAEYERQREASKRGDPVAVLLEPLLTFGGGGYSCSGFRGDHRGGVSSPSYQRTLRECHRIMNETKPRLSALDWQEMKLKDLGPEDTVVLDPPYPSTDVRSYNDVTGDYDHLVDTLLGAKFRWLLCGYVHPALQRLGSPCWAKDVRFLYFTDHEERKFGEERRIECMWKNSAHVDTTKRYVLPPILRARLRIQDSAASLSFPDLDSKIDEGLKMVANDWNALLPYLLEMNRRLSAPGKRTDLRKGAPVNLTWTEWVQSKRNKLGRGLRTVQYLLRGRTETSRARQALAQARATLRSEPESLIPKTPMEIATEMSRLVLEMRDNTRNDKQRQQKLVLLAQNFLRITGQESGLDSIDGIELGNRTTNGVIQTMSMPALRLVAPHG
jgi:site-specific DNA-adenine methylase